MNSIWTLTLSLVPENYPRQKHPKSRDTFTAYPDEVYAREGDVLFNAFDVLAKKARNDIAEGIENDHVGWIQLSLHNDAGSPIEAIETDPDWSYSFRFRTRSKVWKVKPVAEALSGFETMLQREATTPEKQL